MAYRTGNQQYPPAQYDYNPYDQSHNGYNNGGYGNDGHNMGRYDNAGYPDDPSGGAKERDKGVFEADDAIPVRPTGPKTSGNMRKWRNDYNSDLWDRGGFWPSFGRFLCCTVMIAVFIILSILLSLALWIEPPSVSIGDPTVNTSGITIESDALIVPLDINISVNNPNYFAVDLTNLQLDLYYPLDGNKTAVGNGEEKNVKFNAHANTNFTFDLNLQYNITSGDSEEVLVSLAQKCGLLGSSTSDITVDYTVHLGVKVLYIPVNPTISSSFSFACPLSSTEIEELLKDAGIDLGDLGSLRKRR